jgi:hypothetical protein
VRKVAWEEARRKGRKEKEEDERKEVGEQKEK